MFDVEMAAGSVLKPVENPDVEMATGSVLKPAENPADLMVCWYNITWDLGKIRGADRRRHETLLQHDLQYALNVLYADIVLLSECGEIEAGLPEQAWLRILRDICGEDFDITHQSHYTSIVRTSTVRILSGPTLKGPMTALEHHAYRKCQHLQVVPKWESEDSAFKPIDVFNVHSPASGKRPLGSQVHSDVTDWFNQAD